MQRYKVGKGRARSPFIFCIAFWRCFDRIGTLSRKTPFLLTLGSSSAVCERV
nr:MAG TPA: hypothetical protein [Caudoviricetes sp.]